MINTVLLLQTHPTIDFNGMKHTQIIVDEAWKTIQFLCFE